jgi:hypothetical protein
VTPCGLLGRYSILAEDGDSIILQNIGICLWIHTMPQPRRTLSGCNMYFQSCRFMKFLQLVLFQTDH